MTASLCISVTFLDPLFHGMGDGDVPEWPPSPMRLFQALLAGSRTGCRGPTWSDAKAAAFHWLEGRAPPDIVAPVARRATGSILFVPNNDADKTFDRQDRLTSKTVRPQRLTDGDTLHYLWPLRAGDGASARGHAELLCREARHLLALGWGIDQVVGNGRILADADATALSGQRWREWDGHWPGHRELRVPMEGSLADLERVHESFLRRVSGRAFLPPLKPKRFALAPYLPSTALPPRSCAVFELPEGVAFPQTNVIQVAAMLRSLACRPEHRRDFQAQFTDDPEVYLAGHIQDAARTPPRFSYLPLPTIGHEHADGMVRRLLLAEPWGGDGSRARWAQSRLHGVTLKDTDGNERGALRNLWRSGSQDMLGRYSEPSRTWATVTPVILPGFDDSDRRKAERLFLKAVEHAALPVRAVTDLTLRKAPFWPGSQHPRLYRRPAYLKDYAGWHVHVRFAEPIPGPLAIGAGRHCGLGVLARRR